MEPEQIATTETPRKPFHKRLSISLAAFIMSVSITLLGAYASLRGPEIVIKPPESVLIYRDGKADRGVFNIAIRLPMINTTADFGDLLLEATIRPTRAGPNFAYHALLKPLFVENSSEAARKCGIETRCVALPGLLLAEGSDDIVDVPGGAARSHYYAFALTQWNCRGEQVACARFAAQRSAVETLGRLPLDMQIDLQFNGDGVRHVRCAGAKIDFRYLDEIGWVTAPCVTRTVVKPWLVSSLF